MFESTFPGASITEAKITQRAYVQLSAPVAQDLDAFLRVLVRFSNFLTFAIGQTVSVNSVIGYSAQVKKEYSSGKQIEVPIKIIYEGKGQPEAHSRVKADRLLFSFGQVQQIIKRVLDSWIKNYDVAEPACTLPQKLASMDTRRVAFLRLPKQ